MHNMSGGIFRKVIAYVQMVMLVSIICSGMLFMHKHTTASGQIIVHIHPYNLKTDPDASKHHQNENEIHFLDVVFHGSYLQTDFISLPSPFFITPVQQQVLPVLVKVSQDAEYHLFLRGPPSIFVLG